MGDGGQAELTDTAARILAWKRADEERGHSIARVEAVAGGWLFHGAEILAGPAEALACQFLVQLDADWLTTEVRVRAISVLGEQTLELRADASRRWSLDGEPAPQLDGCLDVDVAATPLTNTFPIRRLSALAVGERSTSPVAWVEVPSLAVTRVEQTYVRLGAREWEYSDPTHGAFRLTVDDDGLVVDYEGFATRVHG